MPLRPSVWPLIFGPWFWAALLLVQAPPDVVPSTITVLRFIPRMKIRDFVIRIPAGALVAPLGVSLDVVLWSPGPIRIQSPGLAASTAAWMVVYFPATPWYVPTSSTFAPAVADSTSMSPHAAAVANPRTRVWYPSTNFLPLGHFMPSAPRATPSVREDHTAIPVHRAWVCHLISAAAAVSPYQLPPYCLLPMFIIEPRP